MLYKIRTDEHCLSYYCCRSLRILPSSMWPFKIPVLQQLVGPRDVSDPT